MGNKGICYEIALDIAEGLRRNSLISCIEVHNSNCPEWANVHIQGGDEHSVTISIGYGLISVTSIDSSLLKRCMNPFNSGYQLEIVIVELSDPDSFKLAVNKATQMIMTHPCLTQEALKAFTVQAAQMMAPAQLFTYKSFNLK